MTEVLTQEEDYYIQASSDLVTECSRVLKEGETFAIFDCHGDIKSVGLGEQGIFHEGTRFLSRWELYLADQRPLLLGSTINRQNELLAVDLMNPDLQVEGRHIRRDLLHIYRSQFIWKGNCFEQLRLTNFSMEPLEIPLFIFFEADYADIFEVRGSHRSARGEYMPPQTAESRVILTYRGLDDVERSTHIEFSPQPHDLNSSRVEYRIGLQPKESFNIQITVSCKCLECESCNGTYDEVLQEARASLSCQRDEYCEITTDNAHFNMLLARSQSDLIMMTSCTEHGLYPYAGVPWFSTTFGRDGIITALELLWVNPNLARGVLGYLAQTQADQVDVENDAEPGKVIHETRKGEMAALGEVPFGCYYGSVDATPLFVVLASAYYRRTGDLEFIKGIWKNVLRALDWIDNYGDADGDGFVEYARHSQSGLVQQGWKDSNDSVFHADGTLAHAPIALCEVQGYVYAAKAGAQELATAMGEMTRAEQLGTQAEALRRKFYEKFWCEEISSYALALDGNKTPCRVRSSNAGHCLYSGIASPEHARVIAEQMVSDAFYSGWGLRTIAHCEKRYNPMSYHNGSIWPHDNALVAYGLARYGFSEATSTIFEGLFEASLSMDLHRLPELFCGFKRRDDSSPILYPLACAPQAWAAASVYLLLQGCIGLDIDARGLQVSLTHPVLPRFLNEVTINNLRVAGSSLDLIVKRYGPDVTVSVTRKDAPVRVVIVK